MFIYIIILISGLIGFFIHLFTSKEPRSLLRIVRLFLLYQIVFSLGITSILAFIGLMFMSDYVAAISGWNSCPFEKELANVNLGYAVLAFMCIWKGDEFWLATIIGSSIWLITDGIGHIGDLILHGNNTSGNAGVPLYTDIIVPLILCALYALYRKIKQKSVDV